jgi:hypothetical protein
VGAVEHGFDAILEQLDVLGAGWFLPEHLDALGVGARAVFLVRHAGQGDEAQEGEFPADDGEHLQAVHFGHAQIGDEHVERLGFQHGDGARAGVADLHLRMAGDLLNERLVQFQHLLIIVEQEDFVLSQHTLGEH